ncbi:MAG: Acetyltransferase (GNAT) family protein [Acidobacteria bacterium OLB17]|nr:MAG: Acetyltransferase (GNAT) family protein [Acidobacteria bacterium OLB17]MCZ2390081.1 GNAT family N-acetyltransferase [Acidobacteriota bacterium]
MLNTAIKMPYEAASQVPPTLAAPLASPAFRLRQADEAEVLRFLAVDPVQTVVMCSYIADNGIESELNRGTFFGHRASDGRLDGVALIGHSTLVEARSEDAMTALAATARTPEIPVHLIMSNGNDAQKFFDRMSMGVGTPRLRCVEDRFEAAFPFAVQGCEYAIANADESQLEIVARAQAELAFIECGVDPMIRDREGFLSRVARRIEQGRVFSIFEDGKLLFKADIIAETKETIYLEGIYVHPEFRSKGIGARSLAALTVQLLSRVPNICLLSNVDFVNAHKCYGKAGYRRTGQCVTLLV